MDLVNFFQKNNFSFFEKMLWGSGAIFWDFWFAPRKISRWKNSFIFQRLMFLYQLVNLVLETCFIFSKTLKLGKTFCLEFLVSFEHSNNERYDSPIPDYFFGIVFKKMLILECLGVFYKVNCGVHLWFFWHISFRKMFELLTCKRSHNFWVSGVI